MKIKKSPVVVLFLLLPGLGLILFFIGTIIVMAVAQSVGFFNFSGASSFTLKYWQKQIFGVQLWHYFFYSLKIATFGSFLSVLLAYPLALWLRKPFTGSLTISAFMKVPMLVHGLVAAFLYVNIIAYHGFFNEILILLGIIKEPLRMQNDRYGIGIIILQVWKQMPFALLLLTGSVRSIGDDILFAAQDLGAGAFHRFRKIVAPLTLKSLQASLVIIFIGAASDFSFQVIAGPTHVNSMAQYMYRVQNQMGGWNEAAVIAVMLMLLSLVGSIVVALITSLAVKAGQK